MRPLDELIGMVLLTLVWTVPCVIAVALLCLIAFHHGDGADYNDITIGPEPARER